MPSSRRAFSDVTRIPSAVMSSAAFAALIQLSTVTEKSATVIQIAENFAIGIPILASVFTLSYLKLENDNHHDFAITVIGILFLVFGGYFCVNGFLGIFAMFSARAAKMFGYAVGFWSFVLAAQFVLRLSFALERSGSTETVTPNE